MPGTPSLRRPAKGVRPWILYTVALAGILALSAWGAQPAPSISIEEAVRHVDQDVRMEGRIEAVEAAGGTFRFHLRDGAWAIPVTSREPPPAGTWAVVEGRLDQWRGTLRLDATSLHAAKGPEATAVAWATLREEPAALQGLPLRLAGVVADGTLLGPGGTRIALGPGDWPPHGPVDATGHLAYAEACLCYRLHAQEVVLRTP